MAVKEKKSKATEGEETKSSVTIPKKKKKAEGAKTLPGISKKEEVVVQLPKEVQERKIVVNTIIPPKPLTIESSEIGGVTRCLYVNDIHDKAPVLLHEIFWLRLINNRHVMVRCSQADYEWVIKNLPVSGKNSLITVIDCSNYPTLSYCWKLDDMKGLQLPTLDMIQKYETDNFTNNPTLFHNEAIVAKLKDRVIAPVVEDEPADFFMDEEEVAVATEDEAEEDWFTEDEE